MASAAMRNVCVDAHFRRVTDRAARSGRPYMSIGSERVRSLRRNRCGGLVFIESKWSAKFGGAEDPMAQRSRLPGCNFLRILGLGFPFGGTEIGPRKTFIRLLRRTRLFGQSRREPRNGIPRTSHGPAVNTLGSLTAICRVGPSLVRCSKEEWASQSHGAGVIAPARRRLQDIFRFDEEHSEAIAGRRS